MKFKIRAYEKEKLVHENIFETPQEAQKEIKKLFKKNPFINLITTTKV